MKLGMKIGAVSGGALIILLIVGITSYMSVVRLIDSNKAVEHTDAVLHGLTGVMLYACDVETSARGYVITGNESYLDPYHNAMQNIHPAMEDLKHLTVGNPEQQAMLTELEPVLDEKLDYLKHVVDVRRSQGYAPAADIIRTQTGRALMVKIRNIIDEMTDQETKLFVQRSQDNLKSANNTLMTIVAGTGLAIAFVSFFVFFVTQDITGPIKQLIYAAERIGNGKFEPVSVVNSAEEIGELAGAFDQMSQSLKNSAEAAKAQRRADEINKKMLESLRNNISRLALKADDLVGVAKDYALTIADQPEISFDMNFNNLLAEGEELSRLARSVSDGSVASRHAGESDRKVCEKMVAVVNTLADLTSSAAEQLAVLSDRTEDGNEIFSLIDNIGNKVHLLALSASMEFSRQGEMSAASSALINELKMLAETTKQDGSKMRHVMSDIRKSANKAVVASEESKRNAGTAVKMASQMASKLDALLDLMAETERRACQFSDAVNPHASGITQLIMHLERLQLLSGQRAAFIKQAEQKAREVDALAETLNEVLDHRG